MTNTDTTEKKLHKKTFSKDPNSSASEFQVENMKHKIKSVKKKKKMYNYNNIEQLQNIHDDVIIDSSNNTVIEGLPKSPIAKFSKDEYEGGDDDIYEPNNPPPKNETDDNKNKNKNKNSSESIRDFFGNADSMTGGGFAEAIIRSLTNEKVYEKDTRILKNYIYSFFALLVAFFLTVNFCVTMFLRIDGKRLGIVEYDPYDKNFDTSKFASGYPVIYRITAEFIRKMKEYAPEIQKPPDPRYEPLDYLLSGPLFVSDTFGKFVETAPDFLSNIFNVNVLYILTFVGMFTTARYGPDALKTVFMSATKADFSSPLTYIPLIGILWAFGLSFASMSEFRVKLITSNSYFMILWILFTIAQLLLFIFLGPAIGAVLFVGLFILLSCFSLLYFSEGKMGIAYTLAEQLHTMIIEEMREYEIPSKNNCRQTGFVGDFKYYLNRMSYFVYKNLHYLSFIVLFAVAGLDYYKNMRSDSLKNKLIPLTMALIVGLTTLMDNPFSYIFQTADSP